MTSPALLRRSFLQTGLCWFGMPALSNIGLLGISACQAETRVDDNGSNASDDQTDHQILQSKLDGGGTIYLDRVYHVAKTLYISGNTQVIGKEGAKIIWTGPADQSIIKDTSTRDRSIKNNNILLDNFQIEGRNLVTGSVDQLAIDFYRTSNVVLRKLVVHGVGGSGIRWGNSYHDTADIIVENCTIFDCRSGDALQGSGRRIVIRNNIIGTSTSRCNFGDTGIALIMDFDHSTNPESLFSREVTISGNIILGNHGNTGFGDTANKSQTGIACGPFSNDFSSFITIYNNKISGCYVNIWLSSMKKVNIIKNKLDAHYSNLTGNLRLDNVSDASVIQNDIATIHNANNPGACAVLIYSRRSVYGNSIFDGDIVNLTISGNTVTGSESCGIRMEFGEKNSKPHHISRIDGVKIIGHKVVGLKYPVFLAPVTGETPGTLTDMAVEANVADGRTTDFITMLGRKSQYDRIHIERNTMPGRARLMSGTGTRIE